MQMLKKETNEEKQTKTKKKALVIVKLDEKSIFWKYALKTIWTF